MTIKTDRTAYRIYRETQELALVIARAMGWDVQKASVFCRERNNERDARAVQFFNVACKVQEHVHGHEMEDIIEEITGNN